MLRIELSFDARDRVVSRMHHRRDERRIGFSFRKRIGDVAHASGSSRSDDRNRNAFGNHARKRKFVAVLYAVGVDRV